MAEERSRFNAASMVQIGLLLTTLGAVYLQWSSYEKAQQESARLDATANQKLNDIVDQIKAAQSLSDSESRKRADGIAAELLKTKLSRDAELAKMDADSVRREQRQADSLDRLTDRVNKLTDVILTQRPRSDIQLDPLPHLFANQQRTELR